MSTASRVLVISSLLAVFALASWTVTTYGTTSENRVAQSGRYSVSAADGYALLVDTKTGCTWRGSGYAIQTPTGTRSGVTELKLISVEGLYQVATPVEEKAGTQRTFPTLCEP